MRNDVYLAGYADPEWRAEFKDKVARDVIVFDSFDHNYASLTPGGKAELIAKELENINDCELVVFYLCKEWDSSYSMIQLGDTVGQGRRVIVYVENGMDSEEKIVRYCEYRGIIVVSSMEDLIENVEEYLAQTELAKSLFD